MKKHILIADNYQRARYYMRDFGLKPVEFLIITPDNTDRIRGLKLSKDCFTIVGDPYMPYSFWTHLQERIKL
jgi:hypothetical protein